MEIIKNVTSGRYTVTLGGIVWNNCTADVDCPGRGLCAVNQSWSEYPRMCYCNFLYQHQGGDCGEVGPYGIIFFIIMLVSTSAALGAFFVSVTDLYKLITWGKFKWDALSTSLVLTVIALLLDAIITAASNRFVFLWLPIDKNGFKDDHILIGTIGIGLVFFFTSLSMLNISLVWIQIADNAEKVRKSKQQNISRYRNLLIAYYIVFLGLIIMALAMGNNTLTAPISAPGILFVMITYLYGGFRMRKMSKAYLASAPDTNDLEKHTPTAASSSTKNLRDSLKLIQYAALSISFISLNFVVWVSTWALLGGTANSPDKPLFRVIATGMFWFWATLGPVAVAAYLHAAIKRRGQVKMQGSGSDNKVAIVAAAGTEHTRTTPLPKRIPPTVAPEDAPSSPDIGVRTDHIASIDLLSMSTQPGDRLSLSVIQVESATNDGDDDELVVQRIMHKPIVEGTPNESGDS